MVSKSEVNEESNLSEVSMNEKAYKTRQNTRVVAPVSPDPRNPGFLRYFQSPKPGGFFPRNPGVFKQIHA